MMQISINNVQKHHVDLTEKLLLNFSMYWPGILLVSCDIFSSICFFTNVYFWKITFQKIGSHKANEEKEKYFNTNDYDSQCLNC